ncbi:hypothetical protein [Streptomyces omiyaensis]|uniref:Uncharacterized protein n=1 Tax=Streptomyces omiyaensis TaxID=68247 RepID=A0ABW7BXN9_9ACTN|nr:hypothetical protein [Streptomyces omiyaensis]GGY42631.1 hypothetical protein GCM10010363_24090 [Streptomyces omiyaensis]
MRLNQLDDGTGGHGGAGGAPDLRTAPEKKRAAANTIETELEPDTGKAAKWADEATTTAVATFGGWAVAAGLKTVDTTWNNQVKTLLGRLAHEKGALRGTVVTLTGQDLAVRTEIAGVRPVSSIAGY